MKLSWSEQAKQDLRDIRDYSVLRWGDRVARDYIEKIVACAKAGTGDPARFRPYYGAYRYARAGAHYVMVHMDETGDKLTVVRVLHESMDITRHLPDPRDA